MKKRKLIHLLLIVLPVAAVILTGLPNAVKMKFASPDGPIYQYVSGFSLLPVGYALWGPMASGIGSGILAILGIIIAVKENDILRKCMLGFAVTSVVMSLTTAVLGCMTVIGGTVTALLAIETVLICCIRKRD